MNPRKRSARLRKAQQLIRWVEEEGTPLHVLAEAIGVRKEAIYAWRRGAACPQGKNWAKVVLLYDVERKARAERVEDAKKKEAARADAEKEADAQREAKEKLERKLRAARKRAEQLRLEAPPPHTPIDVPATRPATPSETPTPPPSRPRRSDSERRRIEAIARRDAAIAECVEILDGRLVHCSELNERLGSKHGAFVWQQARRYMTVRQQLMFVPGKGFQSGQYALLATDLDRLSSAELACIAWTREDLRHLLTTGERPGRDEMVRRKNARARATYYERTRGVESPSPGVESPSPASQQANARLPREPAPRRIAPRALLLVGAGVLLGAGVAAVVVTVLGG